MKSKKEVSGSLRGLVRRLLEDETPNMKWRLLESAVDVLADDLCDEPATPDTPSLPEVSAQSWAQSVLVELEKRERAARNDIPRWEAWLDASRILCAKLREATPKAPESWQEERVALLAENAQLRVLNKVHRGDLASVLIRPNDTGWKTLLEEVATLLETNRANERNAKQSAEQHRKCRRVITRLTQWMAQEMATGPFHGSRVAHVQDKLKALLYEQFGPADGA